MTSATSAASAGMLTAEVTTPPVRAAATCSATTTPARSWASEVEAPRCGVTTTPGSPKSGLCGDRLLGEDVDARARQLAAAEGLQEGLLVDHVAARGVDEAGPGLHGRERLASHEAARLVGGREVQGDEVAHPVEVLGRVRLLDAQLPVAALRHEGVVGHDHHPEALRALGDHLPDAAEAEHAEGLAGDLDAAELRALPAPLHQARVGLGDVARLRHHQGDGVLGRRQGVGPGGVADDDAPAGGRRDVDVVDAGAGAAHHLEPVRAGDQLGRDLGRAAHHQGVVVADALGELLRGPVQAEVNAEPVRQELDARLRDLLAHEHAQVGAGQHPGRGGGGRHA